MRNDSVAFTLAAKCEVSREESFRHPDFDRSFSLRIPPSQSAAGVTVTNSFLISTFSLLIL
jgi:hypothetical protein